MTGPTSLRGVRSPLEDRVQTDQDGEVRLVDAEEVRASASGEERHFTLTDEEARDLDHLREDEERRLAAKAVVQLSISRPHLDRSRQVRAAFEAADDDSDLGERLLHELVANEVAIVGELTDIESTLAAMFRETLSKPELLPVIAKAFKEAEGLNSAIRRRIQNSLVTASTLRAHRHLRTAQRGRIGV